MTKRNFYLTILLWLEIVVCLRTLLFVLPLWINEYSSGRLIAMTLSGWYTLIVTIAALYFFFAGVFWLTGFKFGKVFHYAGFTLVFVMSAAFISLSKKVTGEIQFFYIVPLILAMFMVIAVSSIREKMEKI